MSHQSKTTTDHAQIKKWVEEHGGKPATVGNTADTGDAAGILRIDLPGGAGNPPLTPISWDDFFTKFDAAKLAFLYQDKKADGDESHFCKFVSREAAHN